MTKLGVSAEKLPAKCGNKAEVTTTCLYPVVVTSDPPSMEAKMGRRHAQRKWAILGTMVVVVVLLGLSLVAGYMLGNYVWRRFYDSHKEAESTVHHRPSRATVRAKEKFSFDDIFDYSLRPKYYDSAWVGAGSVLVHRGDDGHLYSDDVSDATAPVKIMDNSIFEQLSTGTYYISPDLLYVLLRYQTTRIWRHSYVGKYKIYDIVNQVLLDFTSDAGLKDEIIHYARWAPVGHKLAFVYKNNLYYQAAPNTAPTQITDDGETLTLFNGIPDWVYEEDVLGSARGHYWSPDGAYICFAKFNASDVPIMRFPSYGDRRNVFPNLYQVAYPKAGDIRDGKPGPNTKVEFYVVNTASPVDPPKKIEPPTEYSAIEHYYVSVQWKDDTNVYIVWTDRPQNHSITSICDVSGATVNCIKNYEQSQEGGWLYQLTTTLFTNGGAKYLTVLPSPVTGEQGNWRHLAHVPSTVDATAAFLTTGTEEISSVLAYDSVNDWAYYYTTGGDPTERHVSRVKTSDPSTKECLTCAWGDGCRYTSAVFSGDAHYFKLTCSGPDLPTQYLVGPNDNKNDTLVDNADVKARLDNKLLPTREYTEVDINGGYKGKTEIFFPPNFDSSKKYRLLHYVYAGPNSQRVTKTYPMGSNTANWLTYLKSSHDLIVTSTDGRGTLSRGDKFKFEIYRKMGVVEVADQTMAADNLKTRPYIDSSANAAVFGWSYGGQTSSLSLADSDTAFQCGIAVAPVTSKFYYDTAYTERYLGYATVDDNEGGYNGTDVMARAAKFKNKKYLIAHGTKDDNVHFMHFTQMVNALVQEEVQFRQQVYLDENHYIAGQHNSRHLYRGLTDFLMNDCWPEAAAAPPATPPCTSGGEGTVATLAVIVLSLAAHCWK